MNKRWLHAVNQIVTHEETHSGSEIEMQNTVRAPIGVKVHGRSAQAVTEQGKNLFNKSNTQYGAYLDYKGEKINEGYWGISDYIHVKGLLSITASGYINLGTAPATCFYDQSKTFISAIPGNGDKSRVSVAVPSTACYMRFSHVATSIDTLQLESGDIATDYNPFVPNSPSPEYPSVIKSVGDSGKMNVVSSISRRNIIPLTNQGQAGWKYSHYAGGNFTIEDYQALGINAAKLTCTAIAEGWGANIYHSINRSLIKNNTNYKLSFDVYSNVSDLHNLSLTNRSGTNRIGNFGYFSTKADKWSRIELYCTTNSATETDQVLYFSSFNRIGEIIFANLQMVEGDSIDKWSPAIEDILSENSKQYDDKLSIATVNLPAPLRSLPNGIHDVLECKDGVWGITRNVSSAITFPPRGASNEYEVKGNGSVRRNWIDNKNTYVCVDTSQICVLAEKYAADTWDHLKDGSNAIKSPYSICGWDHLGSPRFDVMVPESTLETKDAAGFTKYLTENPPVFYAQLKAPTWEPLDESSQKALNNLLSYSDKCYTYTTDPLRPDLEVTAKVLGR